MENTKRLLRKGLFLIGCIACLANFGCKGKSESTEGGPLEIDPVADSDVGSDGLDGEAILKRLSSRYAAAWTYSDRGVLNLSYRLNGQYIEEPQRWTTSWDRRGNRLAVAAFNTKLIADGRLLSCYVYDIESGNLDNQHRLAAYDSTIPITSLYQDKIAQHFLAGYSELPLSETVVGEMPKLIPAPVSLLTQQVQSGWLQNPTRVERRLDETIDSVPCYVVRCLADGMTADIWIEKRTDTIMQMSLPLKLLAGEVITTPDEITDVVLIARFHDVTIDADVSDDLFSIPERPNATPVKKFVALPEPYPSEMIGEHASDFELLTPQGERRDKLFFDGKVIALMWVGGPDSYDSISKLGALAKQMPANRFQFASIYSEGGLKEIGVAPYIANDEILAAVKSANLMSLFDPGLSASVAMGIKVVPSVIVLDGESRVQFARALTGEKWPNELKAAMERVANGDDVASEMKAAYGRFIATYQQQLRTVSAAHWVNSSLSNGALDPASHFSPVRIWSNQEFQKAGNVVVLKSNRSKLESLLVFDGWQTVVEVSVSGDTIARHELDFPGEEGASLLRVGQRDGQPIFAVFGPLGKQAILLDHSFKQIGVFPSKKTSHAGIRECQFVDANVAGNSDLVIAFAGTMGTVRYDLVSGMGTPVSIASVSSIAQWGNGMVLAAEGKVVQVNGGQDEIRDSNVQASRIATLDGRECCGLVRNVRGKWSAVGLNESLEPTWSLAIGVPFFDSEVNPISATRSSDGRIVWGIADSDSIVHLVSGDGKWIGDFQASRPLSGFCLANLNGFVVLVTSGPEGIEGWKLETPSP